MERVMVDSRDEARYRGYEMLERTGRGEYVMQRRVKDPATGLLAWELASVTVRGEVPR